LGIEACYPRVFKKSLQKMFWPPEYDALLGTESDQKIADRLGLTHTQVSTRRRKLGIPPKCPIPEYDWDNFDHLLGTNSDAKIAKQVGCTPDTTRRRRRKLHIEPYQEYRQTIIRNDAVIDLLAEPTREIGEISSSAAVCLRKELKIAHPQRISVWTPEVLARVGEEDDRILAKELGLKSCTVAAKRRKLGRLQRRVRRWTDEDWALLAEIPDDEQAAERLNRTRKSIVHARVVLRTKGDGG